LKSQGTVNWVKDIIKQLKNWISFGLKKTF